MSLSSIKLNCCGSGSWGRHPGWLAHAWPTLSTGELSQKVPTETAKADAATLYLSATWTRARFSLRTSASCVCRALVVLQTSQATPGYPGFQWLLGQWMTPYLGRKLLAILEWTPPVSQLSLGTTSTNAAMNRKFTWIQEVHWWNQDRNWNKDWQGSTDSNSTCLIFGKIHSMPRTRPEWSKNERCILLEEPHTSLLSMWQASNICKSMARLVLALVPLNLHACCT